MFGRKTTSPQTIDPPAKEPQAMVLEEPADDFVPLWQPEPSTAKKSFEALLIERGQLTEEQLVQAKNVHTQTPGKSLAQILLTMNAASEAQILEAQAQCLNIPFEIPERPK